MEVLIDAGGRVHRLREDFATNVAEHLRAHPDPRAPEDCIAAADKLERALVGELTEPVVSSQSEAFWVA
jgi:hypothetical protein